MFEKLLEKLHLKQKWRLKTPRQKWYFIYDLTNEMCESIGIRLLSDMKNYWYSYSSGFVIAVYLVTVIYTVGYHIRNNKVVKIFECTNAIGLVIVVSEWTWIHMNQSTDRLNKFQSLAMYWKSISSQRVILNSLINFGGKYLYVDDNKPTKYKQFCEENIGKLIRRIKTIWTLILVSFGLFAIGPFYVFFFKHTRVTVLNTELPFLHINDSNVAFAVNLIQQFTCTVFALIGNLAIEAGMCLVNDAIEISPEVINFSLCELANDTTSSLHLRLRMRNILMQVQDLDR